MADKVGRNDPCPCGSGKKYKRCCGAPDRLAPIALPDPRLIEKQLRGIAQAFQAGRVTRQKVISGRIQDLDALRWTPETPLDKAQDLVYRAWEAPKRRERVKLALQALDLSKDCADAYVLLAEETAESVEQAKDLLRRGVEAGERALGEDTFQQRAGEFWGMVETRPYMRAREGLAACLWQLGEREAAIGHYRDMLRLNPGDNQGVRYALLSYLLETRALSEAENLWAKYKGEPTAAWLFGRALLLFRRHKDSRSARQALKKAMAANKHVADYLLGLRRTPQEYPSRIEFGSTSEAVEYSLIYRKAWADTPGALDWLLAQVKGEPAPVAKSGTPVPGTQLSLGLEVAPSESPRTKKQPKPTGKPVEERTPSLDEWRHVYSAMASFQSVAPWTWMADNDLFGVRDPESGMVGYCSIMGALGEVFGLAVFLGAQGLAGYLKIATGPEKQDPFDLMAKVNCLDATLEDRSNLERHDLDTVRALGLKFRGRKAWPLFRSRWSGFVPWYLTGREARYLAVALEQAVEVAERVWGGLNLAQRADRAMVLVRERPGATGKWRSVWRQLPDTEASKRPPEVLDELRLARLRQEMGRPNGVWQVDLFPLRAPVSEHGVRPYYPMAWLCVDQSTGMVLATDTLEPWRTPAEYQESFLGTMEKARVLPQVLVARPETSALLSPLAQALGIAVKVRRRLPALDAAKRSLASFLRGDLPGGG